jgi:hypothetical protein
MTVLITAFMNTLLNFQDSAVYSLQIIATFLVFMPTQWHWEFEGHYLYMYA